MAKRPTREKKMLMRRCRGPKLGVYIDQPGCNWRRVARAMKFTKPLTAANIHALRTLVKSRYIAEKDDRLGCGCKGDLTRLMEQQPWDGEPHWILCPKCGIKHKVRHEPLDLDIVA